jgi:hypothetical protein
MNKTYKANENHMEEITGTLVEWSSAHNRWMAKGQELFVVSPNDKPEWYDEVVEEPTVSEDEVQNVLLQIAEADTAEMDMVLDVYKLATYLAKLEKRISK